MSTELPEGLTPHYYYPDGKTPTPEPGYACADGALFCVKIQFPVLPLKTVSKIWHRGWDIPTNYAIDASNQVWMDGAHGGALSPVKTHELIADLEDETQRNRVRQLLGMTPEMPSWAKTALAEGWTPPPGWTY